MGRVGGERVLVLLVVLGLLFGGIHGFQISVEVEEEEFASHLKLPAEEEVLEKGVDDQRPFDYFVFAQQWPGTFCKKSGSCCEKVETPVTFTVHGLWPEYYDGSWPQCCSGPGFDQNKIDELKDLLQEYWPTMSCSSPKQCSGRKTGTFWQHEWEKHGTCAYPIIPDEATYFTVGLNLRLKYDISKILKDAGFAPHRSRKYPTSQMVAAVRSAVGGSPIFSCKSQQINEIWICLTKDLKIRDCGASSNSCPKSILIPPFN